MSEELSLNHLVQNNEVKKKKKKGYFLTCFKKEAGKCSRVDTSGLRPETVCETLDVMFMTLDFPNSKALMWLENYHVTFPQSQGDMRTACWHASWRGLVCGIDCVGKWC